MYLLSTFYLGFIPDAFNSGINFLPWGCLSVGVLWHVISGSDTGCSLNGNRLHYKKNTGYKRAIVTAIQKNSLEGEGDNY